MSETLGGLPTIRAYGMGAPYRDKHSSTVALANRSTYGWRNSQRWLAIRVDTLSITYEFTFEDQHPWSEYFAQGAEVRGYLEKMARRYGVYEKIRFGHDLTAARYVEDEGAWDLRFERDAEGRCTAVDLCVGEDDSEDCLAPTEERAWSSPIYIDFNGGM